MLFYLTFYLSFLTVISVFYYSVGNKYKHIVLFSASIGFVTYISWKVALCALVFSSFNYLWGIFLGKNRDNRNLRLGFFWSGIILDIAFLAFFKYIPFLAGEIDGLARAFSITGQMGLITILIPIGISYYTFQALGYIIRINRGSEKAEHDYLRFVTFLLFFPKFLSGPVERSNHFLPQIRNLGSFNRETVAEGIRMFLWGAFKKFVIASSLYSPVHQIYSDVYSYSGLQLLLVFLVQTIYIYTDFSGYTDMALGSARILGINLIDNFNRPFLARNVSEFWRRWHISLSSWCTDFIYNPFIVKYRRFDNMAVVAGVFLTFFTIGIWHAANWTFIVLGLLQATAIVYEFYTKKYRIKWASRYPKSIVNAFSRTVVFLFVCVSMVFFFSHTITDAWYFLGHFLDFTYSAEAGQSIVPNKPVFFLGLVFFALIFALEMLSEKGRKMPALFLKQPIWLRLTAYAAMIVVIYFSNAAFIPIEYMKF